ncbi:MAG: endopeptidase La [Syntrophotaleaceae bacterium]
MQSFLNIPSILPVFPARGQIVFPHMAHPLFVQSDDLAPVDEALRGDRLLGLFAMVGDETQNAPLQYNRIGTVCRVSQVFRFPEGGAKVMLEGLSRVRLIGIRQQNPISQATVKALVDRESRGPIADALMQSVNGLLKVALAYGRPLPGEVLRMMNQVTQPGELADLVAAYLTLDFKDQLRLLETLDPLERLKDVYLLLTVEVQKLQVQGEVQSEVAKRIGKNQKEYLLREQLKQIQNELGDEDPHQAEIRKLRALLLEAGMPKDIRPIADRELARLERISPASPEYTVSRTYLEYLCHMPWNRATEESLDILQAQRILDEDHFNLKEVKERILEFLAVHSLKKSLKGPILCLVGPPGVGKTSLGRSIARAMGRKFIRISLGGMKDEAEIRGHRRTYIGAMPGRIIQEISRVGSSNPVFMLDEVDKLGHDFRGDPASALLEVLDPEQNDTFTDHYLDVPFNLSRVMFITTANLLDTIPGPLRDRMEVIRLSGYSDEEKLQIALRHLIPKQFEENGLYGHHFIFEPATILKLIREYTREAGVRSLERRIASICRKVAKEITQGEKPRVNLTECEVEDLLGARRYFANAAAEEDRVGVATGLAWTENGGDIIFVEVSSMAGKKELTLTGNLGDVMRESARTALSYVRANHGLFGIDPQFFERTDLHIHVPAGAIPKDGPSAGVTIATALISLLTGRPSRRQVAMTGELTLSGRILPIGGIKEKVLAANRAGVKTVLIPGHNMDNLREIDEAIREGLEIVPVESMEDIISIALIEGCDLKKKKLPSDSIPTPPMAP